MTLIPLSDPAANPPAARPAARLSLANLAYLAWMLALTLSFVGFAAANLESFRPVSADEIAILTISDKLAGQGVLGSDLHRGYFGAERHYFIDLPAQYVWQAAILRLSGSGIAQARSASVFFAIVLLWTFGWLTRRWYDLPTALVATLLLLVWRSDLLDLYPGLPFLAVARSARPDIAALAWVWLTLAALTWWAQRPTRARALLVGVCVATSALTHFIGVFVLPLVVLAWLAMRRRLGKTHAGWMAAGLLALILPYLLWIALNGADYSGQMARYGSRPAFGAAGFWAQNLSGEIDRFRPLWQGLQRWGNSYQAYIGPTMLLVVLAPAFGYLLFRLRRYGRLGDWLLFGSLAVFILLLTLLEETKAPLYSLILWPSLCLLTAVMLIALLRWAIRGPGLWPVRVGAGLTVCGFLVLAGWDGREGYRTDWEQLGQVTRYQSLGRQIEAALPSQAPVLGEPRWSWALHDHPYAGLNAVFLRARAAYVETGQLPHLPQSFGDPPPAYLLTNSTFASPQYDFPPGFRQQFWDWAAACATLAKRWDDRTYGRIDLYRIETERPGCLAQTP